MTDIFKTLGNIIKPFSDTKTGMRWVNASEQLPEGKRQIFIRSVHTKTGGMLWSDELAKMDHLENVEWLDESGADYWKKRCEAAEEVLETLPPDINWGNLGAIKDHEDTYKKWQQLKNKEGC